MANTFKNIATLLGLCAGLYATQSHAAFFENTTGLTAPVSVETFDVNAGDGSAAASQFSGLTFGNGNFVSSGYSGAFLNMSNDVISNFGGDPFSITTPTFINFSTPESDVAFAYVSNPGTTTFSSFLAGNLVESAIVNTGYEGHFFGFTNSAFDSIRIDSINENNAYILDNLQLGSPSASAVPEPASIALLGLGLLCFAAARRRSAK